jgi:hypothetical protein
MSPDVFDFLCKAFQEPERSASGELRAACNPPPLAAACLIRLNVIALRSNSGGRLRPRQSRSSCTPKTA